jgi:hypothetical protein
MQYYNAKDKFIMKGAIADSAGLLGHGRGGATEIATLGATLGGASRRVRRGGARQLLGNFVGGASRRVVCVVVVVEEVNALL